ncbi:unnamed protein product, partial [Eretmochelys imbricata]
MKFLYLLSAIVFLMLMDVPGFSHALLTHRACRLRGGDCHFWKCPTNALYLEKCIIGHCCQRRIWS